MLESYFQLRIKNCLKLNREELFSLGRVMQLSVISAVIYLEKQLGKSIQSFLLGTMTSKPIRLI